VKLEENIIVIPSDDVVATADNRGVNPTVLVAFSVTVIVVITTAVAIVIVVVTALGIIVIVEFLTIPTVEILPILVPF
jgi:hypothetical protein